MIKRRRSGVLADQALAIANRNGNRTALIAAHSTKAYSHLNLGDLSRARRLYMEVMEYCREEDFRGEPMADDGLYARIFAGYTD